MEKIDAHSAPDHVYQSIHDKSIELAEKITKLLNEFENFDESFNCFLISFAINLAFAGIDRKLPLDVMEDLLEEVKNQTIKIYKDNNHAKA